MATINDVSRAVHSALEEIGVSGHLGVSMDGDHTAAAIGEPTGDNIDIKIVVHDEPELERAA